MIRTEFVRENIEIRIFGEVLTDYFVEKNLRVLGGAPLNFAAHVTRLLKILGEEAPSIMLDTRVGNDPEGSQIINKIQSIGLDPRGIQVDKKYPTGLVSITVDPNDLTKHEFTILPAAYDHMEPSKVKGKKAYPDLLYFGSLIQRHKDSRETVRAAIEGAKDSIRFFDINLRKDSYSTEILDWSLKHTDILKINDDELREINETFSISSADASLEDIVLALSKSFNIPTVSVTEGSKGSFLLMNNQLVRTEIMPLTTSEIKDTVGAGDSYAAVLAIGILKGWTPEQIIDIATDLASKICSIEGAIPSEDSPYKELNLPE